jgi:hypothetical protein
MFETEFLLPIITVGNFQQFTLLHSYGSVCQNIKQHVLPNSVAFINNYYRPAFSFSVAYKLHESKKYEYYVNLRYQNEYLNACVNSLTQKFDSQDFSVGFVWKMK